ncbi:hypothetical protein Tco_0705095 [Tanacetum coccineum]|uniref:DNA-directed RNA polymerase n=1 Tax=Tanacetum coccineum TaxID=301880 RepID=A0ABQ4Y3P3_9ASTR
MTRHLCQRGNNKIDTHMIKVNKRARLIMHYSLDALPNAIARHLCDAMYAERRIVESRIFESRIVENLETHIVDHFVVEKVVMGMGYYYENFDHVIDRG